MKKLIIAIFAGFTFLGANAQSEGYSLKYAETITKDDLYDYLSILSSDALEGRETGKRGQKMAAAFISNHFNELGLTAPVKDGGYYQHIKLYSSIPGEIYVKAAKSKYKNFKDIVFFGSGSSGEEIKTPIVFAGKGSKEDLNQVDLNNKAALIITDNIRGSRDIAKAVRDKGAMMVFIATTQNNGDFSALANQFKNWLSGGRLSLSKPEIDENEGVFFVAPKVAETIFKSSIDDLSAASENGKLKKIKESEVVYKTDQNMEVVETENVLGYLEGTDLKDELLVITAHYDHEGKKGDKIYNGADDDGSGTSAVLELAEAFAQAKKDGVGPRRSILFMTVTGEEKGLLGSEYYTSNPVFPLENTITDLNIDMIGRVDKAHEKDTNYVYLVGSDKLSSELHEISEKVNKIFTQFNLDYTYNDEDHPDRIYYRSDHWNFAKNNIPVIFYFNGTHEDYHQPTDTIEKINFELLKKRTQLVFYTAWALANRDKRPVVDQPQEEAVLNN